MDIVSPLLGWYDKNARVLPWREEPSPYRVWISEIMLQQTRVEAVKPYFQRFMKAFPTVGELAKAGDEELLKAWEGLGYYNRVRNIRTAAERIVREYGGSLPADYGKLLDLPGIGPYTAGAVASIAFGLRYAAVDGNVLRVVSRLLADDRDILSPKCREQVQGMLAEIMPEERPGDFNQALMELGAIVCVPNGEPLCPDCPLKDLCRARELSRQTDFPRKAAKKERLIEKKTVLLIRDGGRVALKKRPAGGLLAGMYEFPSMDGYHSSEEVLLYLKGLGLKPLRISELKDSKHIFSHREWHMRGFMIRVDELDKLNKLDQAQEKGLLFVEADEAQQRYPIPSAFYAYSRCLDIKLGNEKFDEE